MTTKLKNQAKRTWTTPQLLKLGMYCGWGSALLFLIGALNIIGQQRNAIRTIGKDSAPSIIIAERLKDALEGMNAFAANELLTPPGQNLPAEQGYRERYESLSERIVSVAENITYGDKERKPILILQKEVGDYIAKLQQARDANAQGNTNLKLKAFRDASDLMDNTLIPAANALKKANLVELETSYLTQNTERGRSMFVIFALGIILLAVLITLQIFLFKRTNRILNLGLLAATAIAGGFLLYTLHILSSSSEALKSAKEDAFDSIDPLREMRSLFYAAVADQSRYILDSALATQYEQEFRQKINQIANLPLEQFPSVATAVKQNKPFTPFTGLLANEIKNITFDGEREAVSESLMRMGDYLGIDARLRQLEKDKKHSEAVALLNGQISKYSQRLTQVFTNSKDKIIVCTDNSNPDCFLTQFMNANSKTYDINYSAFYQGLDRAFKAVGGYEVTSKNSIEPKTLDEFAIIAVSATGAICLFTLFGLLPRLREYSA